MSTQARRSGFSNQLLLGALVILVGIVLLVDNLGLYDARPLYDYVPSLFVLLGLYALWRGGLRNFFGPLVVIVLAAAWQVAALDYVSYDRLWDFWPLFLILFGLSLVFSHVRGGSNEVVEDNLTSFVVFGGSSKRSTSKSFTGGDLTALFGGTELDLRDAEIDDPPAHLNVIAMFGGIEVTIPREWNVQLDVLPVLGAASDERPRRESEHDEVDLVVSGFAAFGGVSIED